MLSHHHVSSLLLLASTVVLVAQSTRRVRRQEIDTIEYPTYSSIPQGLSFTCTDRIPGYYADPEAQCQVWHWCLPGGKMYSFLCPNQTMFNQIYRVCDWYYNVDCPGSPDSYNINEDLYKIPEDSGNEARDIDGNNGGINDVNNDIALMTDVRNNEFVNVVIVDDVIPAENNNGFGAIINAGDNTASTVGSANGNGVAQIVIAFDDSNANAGAGNDNSDGNGNAYGARSLSGNNELGLNVNFENFEFGSRINENNSGFGSINIQ